VRVLLEAIASMNHGLDVPMDMPVTDLHAEQRPIN
jgi:hypothetical protein